MDRFHGSHSHNHHWDRARKGLCTSRDPQPQFLQTTISARYAHGCSSRPPPCSSHTAGRDSSTCHCRRQGSMMAPPRYMGTLVRGPGELGIYIYSLVPMCLDSNGMMRHIGLLVIPTRQKSPGR